MKFNKEKFLKSELGANMIDCVKAWNNALTYLAKYEFHYPRSDEYHRSKDVSKWCQAQWEVYQILFRQFYGIEYHFTRTDEYFGIVTNNDDFLFKVEREA